MKYATRENSKEGDTVLIPLDGEHMYKEQICEKNKIVWAFLSPDGELSPYSEEHAYVLE